jgi:hypothetical protein
MLLVLSCSGGSDKPSGRTLEAAIASNDPQAILQDASLRKSDLPPGFVIASSQLSTNEQAASGSVLSTRDEALQRFKTNGRILSLDAEYHPEDLAGRLTSPDAALVAVQVSVTLYGSNGGGMAAFRFGHDAADRWEEWYLTALKNSPNFTNVRSVDSPSINAGDESFSFAFTGDVITGEGAAPVPLNYEFVGLRRGPFLAVLLVGATYESPAPERLRLATVLVARFDDAIRKLTR